MRRSCHFAALVAGVVHGRSAAAAASGGGVRRRTTDEIFEEEVSEARRHAMFDLAKKQSFGYFDDIPSISWVRMRDNAKKMQVHKGEDNSRRPDFKVPPGGMEPHLFFTDHWEPNFSCSNERLVGGLVDGARWVCDPHRIPDVSQDRGGCLVYSVGSNGDFSFELGLMDEVGRETCEFHVFDPQDYGKAVSNLPNVHFHPWGLGSSTSPSGNPANFKSLKETVRELGHTGRVVDILKVDCNGCEWETYNDWFDADLDIRQLLVETNGAPEVINDFFEAITAQGYVRFRKDVDYGASQQTAQEYGFLKLDKSFFV